MTPNYKTVTRNAINKYGVHNLSKISGLPKATIYGWLNINTPKPFNWQVFMETLEKCAEKGLRRNSYVWTDARLKRLAKLYRTHQLKDLVDRYGLPVVSLRYGVIKARKKGFIDYEKARLQG